MNLKLKLASILDFYKIVESVLNAVAEWSKKIPGSPPSRGKFFKRKIYNAMVLADK